MAKRKQAKPPGEYFDLMVEARFEGDECLSAHVARPALSPEQLCTLGKTLVKLGSRLLRRIDLMYELEQHNKDIHLIKHGVDL